MPPIIQTLISEGITPYWKDLSNESTNYGVVCFKGTIPDALVPTILQHSQTIKQYVYKQHTKDHNRRNDAATQNQ